MALKRKTDEAAALPAEPPITWRNMTKVPLEVRRGVLRAALELRRNKALAALAAIDASEALEAAGSEDAAGSALMAAQHAHSDYDLEEACKVAINEAYEDGLAEGMAWAEVIKAELDERVRKAAELEALLRPTPAPAPTVGPDGEEPF